MIGSRSFGLLFFGKLLTTTAVWTHGTAVAILVYSYTDSTLAVAAVTIAQWLPQLILTPVSGAWADRFDPTAQMVIGRVCCVAGSLLLTGWLWCRSDVATSAESTVAVALASLVVGVGFVVGGPAMQAIIPALIRPGELTTAMALNTAPMTLARIVGPTLGAVTVVGPGPMMTFALTAAAHAVFVPMILLARLPKRPGGRGGIQNGGVRDGLAFVRRNRNLARALVGVVAVGVGSEPVLTLAPALVDNLGESPATVGLLTTAFGVGAAVSLLGVSTLGRDVAAGRLSRYGLWSVVAGLVGCAATPSLALCLISTACMGIGFSLALTGLSTVVQAEAPSDLRGRIMALWLMAFVGSRPLAAALSGTIADFTTARIGFAVIAAGVAGLSLISTRHRP